MPDPTKEFLRRLFHSGALDLSLELADLETFVSLFAGEMEALIAVEHARYLEDAKIQELVSLAQPTNRTIRMYKAWRNQAVGVYT